MVLLVSIRAFKGAIGSRPVHESSRPPDCSPTFDHGPNGNYTNTATSFRPVEAQETQHYSTARSLLCYPALLPPPPHILPFRSSCVTTHYKLSSYCTPCPRVRLTSVVVVVAQRRPPAGRSSNDIISIDGSNLQIKFPAAANNPDRSTSMLELLPHPQDLTYANPLKLSISSFRILP
jgi:hypothetical protein